MGTQFFQECGTDWKLRIGEAREVTRLLRNLSGLSAQPLLSDSGQRTRSCHYLCPGKRITSFTNKEEKEHILPFFIIQKNTRKIQVNFWFSATTLTRPSTIYKKRDGPSLEAETHTIPNSVPPASWHTGLEGVQRTLNKI